MNWPDIGQLTEIDVARLGSLSPEGVLYEFDGPCIFTARTPERSLILAYLSTELEDAPDSPLRFVVVTTSEPTVDALKQGVVSVREALARGSAWLVDMDKSYKPIRAFSVTLEALPEEALPADATMLWPELEPALRVRLEGPDGTETSPKRFVVL
ncbi:MAG: hypothetical protein H0U74_10270 [Bradymonadaceae bacterium]|nr:hypothetical protein [Lujinxingiaceae bacterium]